MEENITKRKSASINITIYCNNPGNDAQLNGEMTAFIDPDGNDVREFVFRTAAIAEGLAKPAGDADLYVLYGEGADDGEVQKLARQLEKKGKEYILVPANGGTISENLKEVAAALEETLDMGFTIKDFVQMRSLGIPIEKVRSHLTIFRNGLSKIALKKPAVLNDGIFSLRDEEINIYAESFDRHKDKYKLMKFVPASGAASRMFKFVCEFLAAFDAEKETINAYINRRKDEALRIFFIGIDKFPFFNDVLRVAKEDPGYANLPKDMRYFSFVRAMLSNKFFDYANKPKGILPFHKYEGFIATPVHEHLKESAAYTASNGKADIHFTISEEHLDGFLDTIKEAREMMEAEFGVSINFDFSYQHKQTDTIAVDMHNQPFRNEDGSLLFRPGGHGALIKNLNELDADIVFVKNIDNVSHNNIEVIALYKKALAGKLMHLQQKVFTYLDKIESGEVSEDDIREIVIFAKKQLSIDIPEDISKFTPENRLDYIRNMLDRPIRVCGMVKNEGEPGGGPFWVKGDNGRLSLQIVESSQIDLDNPAQAAILAASSHFNPVDLVCGLKNYKGEKFNLEEFVDSSAGFIVYKNKMGRDLKSYELPGLWNGAMAGWITVFIEVPLATFNPVKTVNDLLKPAHQPQ